MFEAILPAVHQALDEGLALAAAGAFAWGLISVLLSPCHLASIPLVVAYVGGQENAVQPRRAAGYACSFTLGLFCTIAVIGLLCTMLGRMLGDVGVWWQVAIGAMLIWIALGMLGLQRFSLGSPALYRLKLRGLGGAFVLGLAYGILSGTCTFGFIAPILAIVTIQQKLLAGSLMMLLFAAGHCLPIAIAGSCTALVRRVMENTAYRDAGLWFRRGAGLLIALLGGYFMAAPMLAAL